VKERILVVMPTYHSPKDWLDRASKSLKAQTHPDFHCMVVKDGCRWACSALYSERPCLECDACQETVEYGHQLAKEDHRFSFHRLPIHLSGSGWGPRNFAILNSDEDLIAYLDDDNWYDEDHLESLYRVITATKSDLAYTGTRLFDTNLKLVHERLHNALPEAGYIDTSEMMHRRHLIFKFGGWRYVPKCSDWDLVKRWVPDIKWCHTGKITLNFYLRDNCGVHRQ
jgi:glycosyltransferase involved in cell wall biosynthesis